MQNPTRKELEEKYMSNQMTEEEKARFSIQTYEEDMKTGDYGQTHIDFAETIGVTPDELAEQNIAELKRKIKS